MTHLPQFEKTSTRPNRYKAWSVTSMLALQVAALSGGALAATAAFARQPFNFSWVVPSALAGVLVFIAQFLLYRRLFLRP